MVVGVIKKN